MVNKLFELSIKLDKRHSVKRDICLALLEDMLGLERVSELLEDGETFFLAYDQDRIFLENIRKNLIKNNFPKSAVVMSRLRESDWKTKWKKDFQAFQLTKKIMVVPTWQKKKYIKRRGEKIYIDSTVAFGTGLHATTKFMSNLIEELEGKFESFLDIGTGTGILSLVALKNGALRIKAIDIDKEAVKVAKDNFIKNGYNPAVVQFGNIQFLKKFVPADLVAANLMTQDLIRFQHQIFKLVLPGKFLAVSGISQENLPLLLKAFKKLPLKVKKILRNKEWSAVLYQRSVLKEVRNGS